MAKRLATKFVKADLQFTEEEMGRFIERLRLTEHAVNLKVRICENGNQEVVLRDPEMGEDVVLPFEKRRDRYVAIGCTFLLHSHRLAETMRKAIVTGRGNARMHRIYSSFTMVYEYAGGTVVRITERSGAGEKPIYEYRDSAGELERLYVDQSVEEQIRETREKIDVLLDRRNRLNGAGQIDQVDRQLAGHAHRLFVLEA